MIPRLLEPVLRAVAGKYPVVTVTGPRQSGKTTLVRAVFPDHRYASLEAPDVRQAALDDPRGFLGALGPRVILDEAQRAPDLFSYVQGLVDCAPEPGRFIVTGSQNFLLLRSISQSLAGRASVLHLLPFTLDELLRRDAIPVARLAEGSSGASRPEVPSPWEVFFRGSYPPVHDRGLDPTGWCRNYVQTYLERDVRDLLAVGDLDAFSRFLSLCAGRSGQVLNLSGLATDCGVSHTTARRWLSVLRASFQVILLQPYHHTYNKRLVKSPKIFFTDAGLLCYLLRIRSPEDLAIGPMRGPVFETFVVSELWKRRVHAGEDPDLYYWRDSAGHEVDVIVDRGAGADPIPIEIKSGETLAADSFRGLEYFRRVSGSPEMRSVLIHAGDAAYLRRETLVRPWWGF